MSSVLGGLFSCVALVIAAPQLADLSVARSLLRTAVILQFQIKVLWAEDLRIFARSLLCCIKVFLQDCLRDTARKAC